MRIASGKHEHSGLLMLLTLLTFVILTLCLMRSSHVVDLLFLHVETKWWHRLITRPGAAFATLSLCLTAIRAGLWYLYRPVPTLSETEAPRLTVIIPAYNEGTMVAKSVDSVIAARYPRDRLEVIVIDDGSTDDTWMHIERAAERHAELVRTIRFAANRGKRAALAAGFREARGDVVVTIDSDSVIEPDTLLAMAAPFCDARVGAVAGRVAVLNRFAGLIPGMLHVRYALSFDFLRAAQSTFGTVYCCPGALAAYRMSVVRVVLERWLQQTFLGAVCMIGEDRAMTNFILAERYDVLYQRTAVVHTLAPTTYRGLSKMFLRWDRSYIREEFHLARLLPSRPLVSRLFAGLDLVASNAGYAFGYATLWLVLGVAAHDLRVGEYLLLGIGLGGVMNTLYFLRVERSLHCFYGIAYAYYAAFALAWILPYAALTVRAKGWMTR
ncbi:poly-beta-1,6-N-acetyl-D-glucosamine synthase [mine drainage metagenome]|uniref:Poly-beta-1,6-N-acetyl-D-glucosamine synthase n=1 Tax=mine drainage metagenome TaxID=410659 RepID=A0A1J5QJM7_9ZZZZ